MFASKKGYPNPQIENNFIEFSKTEWDSLHIWLLNRLWTLAFI